MRKLVGALAAVSLLTMVITAAGSAAVFPLNKYGLELQLGGGYHSLTDFNNYSPASSFNGVKPELKVNLGAQFGFGLLYRPMIIFGWQFGYNRFVSLSDSKFRITDGRYPESWAEQTISGSEIYAMATWYLPVWYLMEFSFGIGPGLYNATMDRTVDIAQEGGSHLTSGSFADASGRSLGLLAAVGLELPLWYNVGLCLQLGGRLAQVTKLVYKDASDRDITVQAGYSPLPIDFSGGFLKLSLRGYFLPAADWRSPNR